MDGDYADIDELPGVTYLDICQPCQVVISDQQTEKLLAAITEIVRNEIAASRARGGVW